jgi:hypothetical protein
MVNRRKMAAKKASKPAKRVKPVKDQKAKKSPTGVKTKDLSGQEKAQELLFQLGKRRARPKPVPGKPSKPKKR